MKKKTSLPLYRRLNLFELGEDSSVEFDQGEYQPNSIKSVASKITVLVCRYYNSETVKCEIAKLSRNLDPKS